MWSLKWGKSKSECKWQLFAHSFFHWSISPTVKYTDCESWWCWISLHEALTAWGWDSNWAWMGSSCTFVEVSPSPTTSRYLTLWGGRRPLGSAKTAATASQCAYPEPVHWLRTMSLLVTPNLFIIIAGLSYVVEGMRTRFSDLNTLMAILWPKKGLKIQISGNSGYWWNWLAILVGPNGTNRPSWMYSTQIQPRSTEVQPYRATNSTNSQNCLIYGFLGLLLLAIKMAKIVF